ncbi:hypothetical protein TA3x_001089 [Tundrisphaera sp. TA3]|uniref:hypothetical protein n=1 Tax=Tundrisphaera sp. TA3 TaxID=3435775 RepID=UPI003EBBEBA3
MIASDKLEVMLKHGVRLAIIGEAKGREIALASDFLATAMRHLKHRRDVLKEQLCPPEFRMAYRVGRGKSITFELTQPGGSLATEAWVGAAIWGYSAIDSLQEIADDMEAYRADAGDGWVAGIIRLLETPGSELTAIDAMLAQCREHDGIS